MRSIASFFATASTKHYDADFDWVINEFGKWESGDLELLSTIVYVDRESRRASETLLPMSLFREYTTSSRVLKRRISGRGSKSSQA